MPQLDDRLKKGISYDESKDKCGCCPDGVMIPYVELAVLDRIQVLLDASDIPAALQIIREAKQGSTWKPGGI
jgi:hypothetical protein